MSSTSVRRIQKELAVLMSTPPANITVVPDETNLQMWKVRITGPPGTPYAKGTFAVSVEFTKDYPFKPPVIKFETRTYHPNIDSDGNICIGLLKTEQWKPATKMDYVLREIYNLLAEPNPDDPLVTSIAEQYRTDRKTFDKRAAEYVAKYAS
ncbi:ubiquitin-conjugating enzyme E2 D/E [Cryptococcus deuterogattii 99/473]|uniref:E2 ubiquitin-conjugating enzyme n=2 Tax=Cryptococcus deuterogattii TaxID=1859096 RepID=A0A0D0VD38_9TREE|nr:ubiquitin-conjugating enzyme E2 D/E [Cryptococcus deuterogattii R265]KIR36252.1 ubiquitin-conjugating enzyme E2 D/E [Cryptococcus deuterogattii MMRL2647]KIR42790.1 ubiquitin-conjugating enzyme E2 D/E [Cryptococcus deuterogattii Ram5]KIR75684.1 ubiquitin-conjugating enzyme E2 D/E [Cryptococcus deuterogattii CA1014]KIY59471.1 ubiquitin-conjugating enzyme E2 D/E [Cryptococcus deuterogattii 99/473]